MTPIPKLGKVSRQLSLERRVSLREAYSKWAANWISTTMTSNLDFSEWGEAFPNRILGAATIDRTRHGAYRIILDGKSFRSPKSLSEKTKKRLAKGGEKL